MKEQNFDANPQKNEAKKSNIILKLQDICFSYHSLAGETEVLKNIANFHVLNRIYLWKRNIH